MWDQGVTGIGRKTGLKEKPGRVEVEVRQRRKAQESGRP